MSEGDGALNAPVALVFNAWLRGVGGPHKYSHHGPFQATSTSVNGELERDAPHQPLRACADRVSRLHRPLTSSTGKAMVLAMALGDLFDLPLLQSSSPVSGTGCLGVLVLVIPSAQTTQSLFSPVRTWLRCYLLCEVPSGYPNIVAFPDPSAHLSSLIFLYASHIWLIMSFTCLILVLSWRWEHQENRVFALPTAVPPEVGQACDELGFNACLLRGGSVGAHKHLANPATQRILCNRGFDHQTGGQIGMGTDPTPWLEELRSRGSGVSWGEAMLHLGAGRGCLEGC